MTNAHTVSPAETLTSMMKRTQNLVYSPYDTANSISREFLSLSRNRDDVYHVRREKVLEAASPPKEVSATPAPALAASKASVPQPISSPEQSSASTSISTGFIEDVRVQADEIIATVVSIALKKPVKTVAFDQSVKALSRGGWWFKKTSTNATADQNRALHPSK
jgi:fatty acid synthase subunit alpha